MEVWFYPKEEPPHAARNQRIYTRPPPKRVRRVLALLTNTYHGSLSFGSTTVGKKTSQTAVVTNTGNATANITQANVSTSQFSVSGLSMPLSLPAGQSNQFQVWFNATSAGNANDTLTLMTDGGVSTEPVALSGVAKAASPQIGVSATNENFGSVLVGASQRNSIVLSNLGGSNLTIALVTVSGGAFGVSGLSTPATIPPGANATLNVTFTPNTAGNASGSIGITSNDPLSPTTTITLAGVGTSAAVAPTIITQPANQTVMAGQTATFTVTATGTAPLSYQWQKNGANVGGATSASYTTPATTTSETGSTFDVVVTNTAGTVTSATATLTVNPPPPPAIQVTPTVINFGGAVVGNSLSLALVISNTGTATLNITQVNESGPAFSVSGFSLPLNIRAGKQSTITVAFSPTSVGPASGSVTILSNAPTSPTSVSLTGTGIAAILTLGINPTGLSFGNVTTGTSSAVQNVSITNTGNSSITVSQISLSGVGFTMAGGNVPVTLSPSKSFSLAIQFNPTVTGSVNGSITIASNATGSPASVSLTGTGVASAQHTVALTWNASTSAVAGYNVYRSTVSGSGYIRLNSALISGLAYTDSTVQNGTTYH